MKTKFDVTKHMLVPKHVKLSDKEKKQLFDQYRISINELPKISAQDPAVKQFGLKSSDVVKIIRKSKTAGESVYYRGVV